MSPMTDGTWEFFVVSVSCPGCLAVVDVDDFGGGWSAKEVLSSTAFPYGGRTPGRGFPEAAWTLRPSHEHPPPDGAAGPDRPFRVPAETVLSVIGVRERVLLCHHAWHPLLVGLDAVERAG